MSIAGQRLSVSPGPGAVDPEVRRHFKRNYAAHSLEGGLFMGAMAFVAPDAILPPFLEQLGASSWLVALCPQLMFFGFISTPLFVAHRIERLERDKPLVLICGIFQRLPFLLAALPLFFASYFTDTLLLAAVMLAPFISGLAGGVSMAAWSELIAKAIPAHRRASASAIRNFIGALSGIFVGKAAEEILTVYPGEFGYGILFLTSFIIFMGSYVSFMFIREPRLPSPPRKARTFLQSLRSLPGILREDHRYRNYLLARVMGPGFFILAPFLAIHAIGTLGREAAFSGVLLSSKSAGILAGNIVGAYIGDRFGGKLVQMSGYAMLLGASLLSVVAGEEWAFHLIFMLWGAGFSLQIVGHQTLQLELAPAERLPTYVALQMTSTLPFMLLAAALSTGFRELSLSQADGAIWPLAIPAGACMVVAIVFLARVQEPRSQTR